MTNLGLSSLVVTLIGVGILTLAFVMQAHKMYTHKHSHGISTISWIQNFLGRLLFSFYMAFLTDAKALPILVSQVVMSILSIPIIYYSIRNKKSEGEYIKAAFRKELFAIRMALLFLSIVVLVICILLSREVNVIKFKPSNILLQVMSYLSSIIVSFSFVPQTIRTIKTRNTKATSLAMTALFTFGNLFFIVGLTIGGIDKDILKVLAPIITISISTFAMAIILWIKIVNTLKVNKEKEDPEDINLIV